MSTDNNDKIKASIAQILGWPVPDWVPVEDLASEDGKTAEEIAEDVRDVCALFEGQPPSEKITHLQIAEYLGVNPDDLDPKWTASALEDGLTVEQAAEKILAVASALEDLEDLAEEETL